MDPKYSIGDRVFKDSGDYFYAGQVVSVYRKLSGVIRYVVENSDGLNFIFNEQSLKSQGGWQGNESG